MFKDIFRYILERSICYRTESCSDFTREEKVRWIIFKLLEGIAVHPDILSVELFKLVWK